MSTLKMTFSLASLILIFALAAIPAMAATIEAEWDATNTQWDVTITAAAVDATTAATVSAFDLSITNPADTEPVSSLTVTCWNTDC